MSQKCETSKSALWEGKSVRFHVYWIGQFKRRSMEQNNRAVLGDEMCQTYK